MEQVREVQGDTMSDDDPIVAALAAKLDGPAETADAGAEPAAIQWPALGQGKRGTPFSPPPDPLLDAVLEQLHLHR